jgi:hypothetical protein
LQRGVDLGLVTHVPISSKSGFNALSSTERFVKEKVLNVNFQSQSQAFRFPPKNIFGKGEPAIDVPKIQEQFAKNKYCLSVILTL